MNLLQQLVLLHAATWSEVGVYAGVLLAMGWTDATNNLQF